MGVPLVIATPRPGAAHQMYPRQASKQTGKFLAPAWDSLAICLKEEGSLATHTRILCTSFSPLTSLLGLALLSRFI